MLRTPVSGSHAEFMTHITYIAWRRRNLTGWEIKDGEKKIKAPNKRNAYLYKASQFRRTTKYIRQNHHTVKHNNSLKQFWLIFGQHSLEPCHPVHHCYSIWPSSGNITNVPTESLWRHHRIASCQKGYVFYSPPSLQIEQRKYAAMRCKGWGMTGAASAGDSY